MLFSALAGVALAHGVEATSTAHYLSDVPSFEEFVLRLRDARYRRDIRRYVHFRDQMDWISIPGRGGDGFYRPFRIAGSGFSAGL